jgi:phenylacetate-coenzyme A ligase PaaK-like adenylate-forming protein
VSSYEEQRARHIGDIRSAARSHQLRLAWTRAGIDETQARGLRTLLAHAAERSPFYRERLAGVDLTAVTPQDMRAIPPVTKGELMERWDDVVTDRTLRRSDLERFVEEQTAFGYYADRYQVFESGGSSGVRGIYVWDWQFFVTTANLAFRYEIRDTRAAGLPAGRRLRRAVVTSGVPPHASTPLFSVDVDPPMATTVFPVSRPLAETVEAMNRAQPTHLIGYSSEIGDLAAEAHAGRLRIAPLRVATNSEPLLPETRELIERVWGVAVNNAWGSTEVGMHAAECDRSAGMHLHEDALVVERVDERGEPVAASEPAAKVLVTSLANRTFPFIRYELDDVITLADEPCPCGSAYRLVREVQGRALDAFTYGSVRVAPVAFGRSLGREPAVVEYQVRQEEQGASIDVVAEGEIDTDGLARAIEADLREAGLAEPRVTVRRVEELERNPVTGKLKRFVPLSRPSR